jgi:hypothetical protein
MVAANDRTQDNLTELEFQQLLLQKGSLTLLSSVGFLSHLLFLLLPNLVNV